MSRQQVIFIALALWWSACYTSQLYGQQQEPSQKVLDEIVAVVGDEIILDSDVRAQMYLLQQQLPDAPDSVLYERAFENILENKLIIAKAQEDSISVTEEEVEQRLDYQIALLVQQFGSEKRVEDVYGISIAEIKRRFKEQMRKQLMGEKLLQQKLATVKVTPSEVEQFYHRYQDSLPLLPAAYELYHLVRFVEPDSAARDSLRALLSRLRDTIIAQQNFAEMAKRWSQDELSASEGGDLGWVRRGELVPEFEDAAFRLQVGEVSEPVETPFGYHLIQVEAVQGDKRKVRHILLKFTQGKAAEQRTIRFLDSLRQLVLQQNASFEELAKRYSQDEMTRGYGGYLGRIPVEQLPEQMRAILDTLPDGGVTPPLRYEAAEGKQAYHIVWKKRFIPAHYPDLQQDYEFIRQMALQWKKQQVYQRWIAELKKEIFWERRKNAAPH